MQMRPVQSSSIHSVGHDGLKLHVQFHNGSIYEFPGRPLSDYHGLIGAKSVGRHFNDHIRQHPNTCIRKASRE